MSICYSNSEMIRRRFGGAAACTPAQSAEATAPPNLRRIMRERTRLKALMNTFITHTFACKSGKKRMRNEASCVS